MLQLVLFRSFAHKGVQVTTATLCMSYHSKSHQAVIVVQVPQDVREARRDELVSLQQHVGESFAESLVGRQVVRI